MSNKVRDRLAKKCHSKLTKKSDYVPGAWLQLRAEYAHMEDAFIEGWDKCKEFYNKKGKV